MTDWLPKIKKNLQAGRPRWWPGALWPGGLVAGGDAVERGGVLIKNNKDPRLVTCDVTRDT